MTEMKETIEQLVLEKAEAQRATRDLIQLLIVATVKNGGELSLAPDDWDAADGYGIQIETPEPKVQIIRATKAGQ